MLSLKKKLSKLRDLIGNEYESKNIALLQRSSFY